ncbi:MULTISPECIES: PQQ-binding-like beta-propeller repeat protein [unclassified Haladaptatus]|uniref:outer membrane protein assembly factor BamB family protein n=1 Tax=unclassified Haladaptatus TaxID=2622732 RepID=UPI00209BE2C7|nr:MULTISPECIES: PQQ-binding-like beta-propeller repeat protein [unclassified Haladaptatus]MCO8242600.1 PQQ-binding-like beta-propeller repeat protein [Haladaptatus sp. AB643]MCO8252359.1 PQQ-binding-like beta-propeller repeat protein [Haladaptatus sp. AB618]
MSRGTLTRRGFMETAGASVPLWNTSNLTRSYAPRAKTMWTADVDEQLIQLTRTVGGIFYAQTEDAVHAISIFGEKRWRYEKEDRYSTVFPTAEVAYIGDGETVYALSAMDGSERWHEEGGDPVGPLTPTSIITGGKEIAALSRKTGKVKWSVEPPSGSWHSHSEGEDGHIYAGTTDGDLVAISTRNGTVEWNAPISGGDRIWPYTVTDGFVLASDYETGTLYVFDARTGEPQWAIASNKNKIVFPGAIGGGAVYYPSGMTLQAYAVADRTPRWHADIGANKYRRIRLFGETVYVGTHKRLQAYATTDGTLRWQFSTDDDHYHFPMGTTKHSLIVHSRRNGGKKKDETTYALSLKDGHVRWQYDHPTQTMGDHHIAYDTVYFSTPDGTIQAITSPGKSQLYDTLRTVVSPIGLATSGFLGAMLLGGGYRRYRTGDADDELESEEEAETVPTWNGYELRDRLDDETHLARTPNDESVLLRRFHDAPEDFERAAEEWAKIDFDGVQLVHDWGIDPEPWIAVERVEGRTLAEVGDSFDQRDIVSTVARTAEIVHQASKEGVGHEDLTAGNIVVDSDVTVTNWRFTGTDESEGVSDEEIVSRLGNIAESLLTRNDAEISEPLADVLETATASNPDERYESALEFADMLRWTVRSN